MDLRQIILPSISNLFGKLVFMVRETWLIVDDIKETVDCDGITSLGIAYI